MFTAENFEFQSPRKETVVAIATELVGCDSHYYVSGHPEQGQSPQAFDCSGFVKFVLNRAGFHIPDFIGMDGVQRPIRHTNEFWDHYGVGYQTDPEGGDLIFFSRRGRFPTHIGIVLDAGSFIHAPGSDGTKVIVEDIIDEEIPPLNSDGRTLYSRNPIGYKALTIVRKVPTYRYHQIIAD